jgi:mannosyltransferase OCH1-like enzyme
MRFWKDLNHDHAYDDFDLLSADKWLEVSLPAAVTSAYRRAREPEQKGDIFRLAWLAREGGIYVSAQDCCLKPISALLPEAASLVVYQDDFAVLGTNFIAAAPSNPVITTALRLAVDAVNRGDSDIGWLSTGPALLTRAFAQFAAERPTTDGRSPDGTVVHTQRVLSQSIAIHCAIDRGG